MANSRNRVVRFDADGYLVHHVGTVYRPWPDGLDYNPMETFNCPEDIAVETALWTGDQVRVSDTGDGCAIITPIDRDTPSERWVQDRILRGRMPSPGDTVVFATEVPHTSAGERSALQHAARIIEQLGHPALANQVREVLRQHSY